MIYELPQLSCGLPLAMQPTFWLPLAARRELRNDVLAVRLLCDVQVGWDYWRDYFIQACLLKHFDWRQQIG